jgi:hypothetical protein
VSYPPPPPGQPPPYGYQQPYGYGYGYPPQQRWQPPPKIDPKQLRPSSTWYWLSAIPAVAGTILGIVFLVSFINQLDPDIDNFSSNRTAELEFNEGDRAIYVQTRRNNTPIFVSPGELRCSVTSVETGEKALLDRAGGSTLEVNSDSYTREYSFDAPRDGSYRVSCEGPEGVRLAVGPDLSFGLFAPLLLSIGSFVLGLLIAGAIAITTAIRRSNHKQRLQREARQAQASGLS